MLPHPLLPAHTNFLRLSGIPTSFPLPKWKASFRVSLWDHKVILQPVQNTQPTKILYSIEYCLNTIFGCVFKSVVPWSGNFTKWQLSINLEIPNLFAAILTSVLLLITSFKAHSMTNESTFCLILFDLLHINILARNWIFCVTINECHYSWEV
jgi:hypothetical protein